MKNHFPLLLLLPALLWLTACESKPTKDTQLPFKDDSTAMVLPQDGTQPSQEDTSAAMTAQGPSFKDQCKAMAAAVLTDEYKEVSLDELEDTPKFKQAREMVFFKYIRRNPIKNKYAGQVIPRIVWKGYHFASSASATQALEEWMNESEHSGDSIVLGAPVDALKQAPIVCAVMGQDVYMLQTPCFYKGEEQDQLVLRFMSETKKAGAKFRFRIGCNAGEVTYESK